MRRSLVWYEFPPARTNKPNTAPAAHPEAISNKPVCWYTASRKVKIILGDEEAYSIFLRRLENGEVATNRGSIVLGHLTGKESEMDPDGLAEHHPAGPHQRTGVRMASRKIVENGCFAYVATQRNTAAVSRTAKQMHNRLKVQGRRLAHEH